jgi:antitoxin component of MazEF toxin-antitoxin module
MSMVVKSTSEQVLTLPLDLLEKVNWREGDEVKVSVACDLLKVERLDKFLRLRGALAGDAVFDKAMGTLHSIKSFPIRHFL